MIGKLNGNYWQKKKKKKKKKNLLSFTIKYLCSNKFDDKK